MKTIFKFIFLGWLASQSIYILFYLQTGYIFGKSDVDNYLAMADGNFDYWSMRHIIIGSLARLPIIFFIFFIPFLFWVGFILPLALSDKDVFSIVFGTASIQLFFIIGLWSQFLSMASLIWVLVFFKKFADCRSHGLIYLLLFCFFGGISLTYIPMWLFLLAVLCPVEYSMLGVYALMLVGYPMVYITSMWSPCWVLILYVCPVLWIKYFKVASLKEKYLFFLFSLPYLGRPFIFLFSHFSMILSKREKYIVLIWWFLVLLVYFASYLVELPERAIYKGVLP